MRKRIFKTAIITIFMLVILLPLLQQITGIVPEPQLVEKRQLIPRPGFVWSSFLTGAFQYQFDAYMNDNYGFRSLMVMINNQINVMIFHVTR
jgi:hypothetical protein